MAYHGVARNKKSNEVLKAAGNIIKGGFKPSYVNVRKNDKELRHPGNRCGVEVYCSPDIKYIEKMRFFGETEFNGEKYKLVLMLRINPTKIRQSEIAPEEYILEPNLNEIRPYRILLKKVDKNNLN